MHPSLRLLQQTCRITLFTRANCSLCTTAKQTLSDVWDTRPFDYEEVDVMKPEAKGWRDLYEFDTPVIHISKSKDEKELPARASKTMKLMHRFSVNEIMAKLDAVEKESA